jgi:hypothetical protein
MVLKRTSISNVGYLNMKKHTFYLKASPEELEFRISMLPKLNLFRDRFEKKSLSGEVWGNWVQLSRMITGRNGSYSFFCGKITAHEQGSVITGWFMLPFKLAIEHYGFLLIASLLIEPDLQFFFICALLCIVLHWIQMILFSRESEAKDDLIHFIEKNFDLRYR